MTGTEKKEKTPMKIVNVGLQSFYDALTAQGVETVQVDWRPPFKLDKELEDMLNAFL